MQIKSEFTKDRAVMGAYGESAGDYVLPDYNGDVKKILFVNAGVVGSGSFPSSDCVRFPGVVEYNIVYLDAEGNVTHCKFDTGYEITVKCNEESYVDSYIDTVVESYQMRLVGPRKFTAKAILESTAHILEHAEVSTVGSAVEDKEPELLKKDVKVRCACLSDMHTGEYREELERIDGVMADETEILYIAADAVGVTLTEADGVWDCKGEIAVFALVKHEGEMPRMVKKSIPFMESFEIEEGEDFEELGATCAVKVVSCLGEVTPTDDGVLLSVSVKTESSVIVSGNGTSSLVKDMFLLSMGCDMREGTFEYPELLCMREEHCTLSETLAKGEVSLENARNLLLADTSVRVSDAEIVGDSAKIVGEVRFSGIACEIGEDNTPIYSGMKLTLPFEKNVNIGCQHESGVRVECHADVTNGCVMLDGGGVNLECDLSLVVSVSHDRREGYVCTAEVNDERYSEDDTVVCVYYPDKSDTLFDVAKRYHKSPLRVASVNSLSESVFADRASAIRSLGVDKLIIR